MGEKAVNPNAPFWVMIRENIRKILTGALAQTEGKVKPAANLLGINYQTFSKYAEKTGVPIQTYRGRAEFRRQRKLREMKEREEEERRFAEEEKARFAGPVDAESEASK